MRSPIIVAVAILALVMFIPSTEAADRPDFPEEPAVLCYNWEGGINIINTYYVRPGEAIGSANIPELIGQVHYWVRMDTGEVVTDKSVFKPGTYMIKAYTTAPTPWGSAEDPSPTNDKGLADTAIIGISIASSVAIVIIGGLLLARIKK